MDYSVDSFRGDRTLLLRAARNLVANAIQYGLEGTPVFVEIHKKQEFITLSVKNTPREWDSSKNDKLFERFYRGEYSRSTPGSGLGLNITREIARRHGGDAGCIDTGPSTRGEGIVPTVKFYIMLPGSW